MRALAPLAAISLVLVACSFDPRGLSADGRPIDLGPWERILEQSIPTTCGDGVVEGSEACDGSELGEHTCVSLGFKGGTLTCTPDCKLNVTGCDTGDPKCGDDIVEGLEQCDGTDLKGGDCLSLGHLGGTLGCRADCTYDDDACLKIPSDWLHKDYAFRKALTIDHTKVEAALTQFPVLVSLKDTEIAAKAQPDGDDLVFTAADGVTRLSHEIEQFDPDHSNPKQVLWVGLPTLSANQDTKIYLYYGNPGCASQQAAAKVWDSGYAGVWHLAEKVSDGSTTGVHQDSTTNARNGAQHNNDNTSGKISIAQEFDGSGDYVDISSPGAFALGDAHCTVSAWIRTKTNADRGILIKADANNHEKGDKLLGVNYFNNKLGIDHGWVGSLSGVTDVTDDKWHHVAWVQQKDVNGAAEQWDLYVDGKHESTKQEETVLDIQGHTLRIGGRCQSSQYPSYFLGRIDEVRISSVARGAAWLVTSFRNQDSPDTFISVGTEQPLIPPP